MVSGNVHKAPLASILFCAIFLPHGLANSAEVQTRSSGKNFYLLFNGPIEQGDFDKVKRAFRRNGYLTEVRLHSPGGNVAEALKIGQFIRTNLIATFVPKGAECLSACPLILIGGIVRRAEMDTEISVHMGSLAQSTEVKELMLEILLETKFSTDDKLEFLIQLFETFGAQGILQQVSYIGRMGVSYELLDIIVSTPNYKMTQLSRFQLRKFNILTE